MVILGKIIYIATYIYVFFILLRVLLSWINPNPYSPFMIFLARTVDPVLNWGRRIFPLRFGGIDFSPIFIVLLLWLGGFVLGQWLELMGRGAAPQVILPLLALALVSFISQIAWFFMIVMIARIIMSLVNPSPYNPLVLIVYGLTEPLLAPMRGLFPKGPGGLDLRALIFLVLTLLLDQVILTRLYFLAGNWIGKMVTPAIL